MIGNRVAALSARGACVGLPGRQFLVLAALLAVLLALPETVSADDKIRIGQTVEGMLNSYDDVDRWKMYPGANAGFVISLENLPEYGYLDVYILVYDGNGTLVASDDNDGAGNNAYITYCCTPCHSTHTIEARYRPRHADDLGALSANPLRECGVRTRGVL